MSHPRPLLLALLFSSAMPAYADEAVRVGVVGVAAGDVVGIEGGQEHALKTGEDVHLGEVVKTRAGGQAQLIFLDRSTLTLKPNSDVTVDRFVYDPAAADGTLGLKSAEGAFRFIGGALSKKKPVTIATPVGTIGIRGGIVDASVSPSHGADAVFVYGKALTLTNAGGATSTTTTFGTGFNLASASSVPHALDASAISQHFAAFRVAPTAAGTGGVSASQLGGKLDLGTEQHQPQPSGSPASPGGGAPVSSNGGETSPAPSPGQPAPVLVSTNGSAASPTPLASPTIASPSALSSVDTGAITATAATGQTERTTRGQDGGKLADIIAARNANTTDTRPAITPTSAPAAAGDGKPPVNTTATTTTNTGGGNAAPAPTFDSAGRYAVNDLASATVNDSGLVRANHAAANTLRFESVSAVDNSVETGSIGTSTSSSDSTFTGASLMIDGKNYNWTGFQTASGTMNYYFLTSSSDQLKIVTGSALLPAVGNGTAEMAAARANSVTRSAAQSTGAISYYNFLPDLMLTQTTASDGGLFSINVPNSSLIAGYNANAQRTRDVALAINWQTGTFLTSSVVFTPVSNLPATTLAFGTVNNDGMADNQHYLAGSVLRLVHVDGNTPLFSQFATPDALVSTGNIAAGKGIYGNANGIDGVVLNYNLNNSASPTYNGVVPASVVSTPTSAQIAASTSANGNANGTLTGYAGGIVIHNAGGSGTVEAFSTNNASDSVQVTQHASTGTTEASLSMSSDAGNTVSANFGTAGDRSSSAYVSDKLWASRQNSVSSNGTPISTGANAANGALIGAAATSNLTPGDLCTTCQFTQWGVWAADYKDGSGHTEIAPQVPVIVGQVTQNLGTSGLTGNASYTGHTYANAYVDNTYLRNGVGTMNATVNLGGRTVDSMNIDIPASSIGTHVVMQTPAAVPINATGPALYTTSGMSVTRDGIPVTGVTSTLNGALYGPSAQEIGGAYRVDSPNLKVGGIYQGKQ